MFTPNFKYTNKIVNHLLQITSARDIILNSYIVPKWEISLRRDALIRSAHASTAIEGNKLTLEEVSKLAEGRQITAERKDRQEVLNYLKALENIDKYHEKGRITEEHLLKSVDVKTVETTQWLEYFIYGVFVSITRVKERVLQLSLEKRKKDTRGQIALTERQMRILESVIKNGKITSGEMQKMFNISRQAAHKEIRKMLALELIESEGEGKAAYYTSK